MQICCLELFFFPSNIQVQGILILFSNNIFPLKHTIIINKSVNAAYEQGSRIMSPGRLYCTSFGIYLLIVVISFEHICFRKLLTVSALKLHFPHLNSSLGSIGTILFFIFWNRFSYLLSAPVL